MVNPREKVFAVPVLDEWYNRNVHIQCITGRSFDGKYQGDLDNLGKIINYLVQGSLWKYRYFGRRRTKMAFLLKKL